jgi:hypothetical protein
MHVGIDRVEIRFRLGMSQLTPGNLLLVAVSYEQCRAGFRLVLSPASRPTASGQPMSARLIPGAIEMSNASAVKMCLNPGLMINLSKWVPLLNHEVSCESIEGPMLPLRIRMKGADSWSRLHAIDNSEPNFRNGSEAAIHTGTLPQSTVRPQFSTLSARRRCTLHGKPRMTLRLRYRVLKLRALRRLVLRMVRETSSMIAAFIIWLAVVVAWAWCVR